jgi:hypothetical protein
VTTYGRLSPATLIALTKVTASQLARYLGSLDPMAPASFAVSWAGETSSANWFDIARELTERWHHQQQIRLAVGRDGILIPRFYQPVLETFMRVLPRAYQEVDAPEGTMCQVIVPGESGGTWQVTRRDRFWELQAGGGLAHRAHVASVTILPGEIAWRVFTKGVAAAELRSRVVIEGDQTLGAVVLRARAIVG